MFSNFQGSFWLLCAAHVHKHIHSTVSVAVTLSVQEDTQYTTWFVKLKSINVKLSSV